MHTKNAKYFFEHLEESFDTYLQKTKNAFSGEDTEIQFFLQNNTFTWKQQNILTRGKIIVNPLLSIPTISDTLKQMLEHYQRCQKRILELERENQCLNKAYTKLNADMEEMITLKNTMEKDLYKSFLLLLNTKKKKNRELQEALNNNKKVTKSLYDEVTDTSDMSNTSDTENKNMQESAKCSNMKKHKANYKQKTTLKNNGKRFKRSNSLSSNKSPNPEPSTSKNNTYIEHTDMQHIKFELLNSSEESEGDLFSE